MPTEPRRLDVGNFTFDVEISGAPDAPAVVLLHGFPETNASWRAVTDQLVAAGLQTIAPNQRGYSPGARPTDFADYHLADLVGDVLAVLDALELPTAHLVGHDWGAIVAWGAAALHPERVRTLTAVSAPHPAAFAWALQHDSDQQQRSSYMDLFRKEGIAERILLRNDAAALRGLFGQSVPTELIEHHVALLTEPGALAAALNWYRALGSAEGRMDEVPPVSVPTTFLWSTDDAAIGRASAIKCAEFATGPYQFIELDAVTHWVPEQAPQSVADAVIERVLAQS